MLEYHRNMRVVGLLFMATSWIGEGSEEAESELAYAKAEHRDFGDVSLQWRLTPKAQSHCRILRAEGRAKSFLYEWA